MPVLEILQLKVNSTISPSDPSILASLQKVRSSLREKVHATNSRFFQAIEDPRLIYLFGLWPSLERHQAFLASPEKPEILSPQAELLEFNWMLHIPLDSMSSLPLDAPVVAVARVHIKGGEHVTGHKEIQAKYGHKLMERVKPYPVVADWRVDGEDGKYENVVITGWETKEDHLAFGAEMREYPDYAAGRDHWEGIEVNHLRELEK